LIKGDLMENGNTFRIGLLKHIPQKWNLEKNMLDLEKYIAFAAQKEVRLFVTCECYLDGYCVLEKEKVADREKLVSISQDIELSPHLNKIRKIALDNRMFIIFGFSQKTENGIKNAAILIDDEGKDIGVYYKTHLYAHDLNYIAGDDLPVFKTRIGTIGIVICADRRWPEAIRTLKLKGAEIVIIPSYGMSHLENEWWMRTRAYENEIYLAFVHPGVGFICGPDGEIEAKLQSNVSDCLIHDIDLSNKVCDMLPYRRPDLYDIICKRN